MSYEVLARRFRPQTFDDVDGQRPIVTALRNAIRLGRVPHALLLSGPRGVGKTTLARILARALNCDQGPTETPCGECAPCREIAAGISLDVQEIDAASNTGVDSVREIRESVRYAAAPGKHRIFIVDEVHMLSTAAFNALLKTLEEPPPRSLFVFATTDPQKIPQTVLSRVQRFDLRRLGATELLALLRKLCAADGISAPESVLRALVREADGSARDALTLLDRLTSALGAVIDEGEAIAILDLIDRKLLVDVLEPVLARDPSAALAAARRALEQGVEPGRLAADLLGEVRNLVVARLVEDPSALIDAPADTVAEIAARAKPHDVESLQRLFRVLLTRIQDLAFAARPDHAFEMAVVRLATLPDTESLAALVAKLDSLDSGGGSEPGPGRPGPSSGGGRPSSGGPGPSRALPPAAPARAAPSPPAPALVPAAPPRAPEPVLEAAPEEPPPLVDDELAALPLEDDPPAPPAPKSALSHEQRSALEARVRAEAKAHPRVHEVIRALDAELREIRIDRTSVVPPPSEPN